MSKEDTEKLLEYISSNDEDNSKQQLRKILRDKVKERLTEQELE